MVALRLEFMNRRTSILTGLAAIGAAATLTRSAQAEEKADNPELDAVRALLKAHDEANAAGIADRVPLMETRPTSATKRWRVVEILEKAK